MSVNLDDVTAALQNTRVTPNGLSFAGQSLKLNSEEDAKTVVDAMNNCVDLEYLNMEGNTLGVDAAKAIAKALEKHSKFKRALWKDMFTGRMKTEIPKALQFLGNGLVKAGAHLIELDLSDNAFGGIGVEGLASLLRSSTCYALEELRLNNNGLGITGGKLLASALLDCYNSSKSQGKPLALKVFIAGRNRLENDGAKALAQVFKTVKTLEEVAMPQNGIYHPGISALSDAFTHNPNLQILNLNDNTIGAKGAEAIAKALPNLQKLKQINFGDCLLKTKGARFLAKALEGGHPDLEELVLGFNEITTEGGLALVQAIVTKSKLKSLVLDGNQFNKAGRGKIKQQLKEIGKVNVLSSLDECDSDEEEEEDDEEENSEESGSGSEEEAEDLSKNIASLKVNSFEGGITSYENFIKSPTAENFLALGNNREELILNQIQVNSQEFLDGIMPILMKITALSIDKRDLVAKSVAKCTERLYKELFSWAQNNDGISVVNNSLLVHLGLIKIIHSKYVKCYKEEGKKAKDNKTNSPELKHSEDKKFKTSWNVEGCLNALEKIVEQNYVPNSTKDTIKVFMQRQVIELNDSI